MKEYTIDDINSIVRPRLGEEVPLSLFQVLRIIGMRSLLGESSGQTLYMMGKSIRNMLGAATVEEFREKIIELKIGIPEIAFAEEDHCIVKLYECITCAGFVFTGELFCDMESGIIAGLLEKVYAKKAKSTQTKSWSAGFNYCEFDIFLY